MIRAAMLAGLVTLIWFHVFTSDPGYRLAMFVPYAVIVNIMFSWVFRVSKLGGTGDTLPTSIPNYAQPHSIDTIVMKRSHLSMMSAQDAPGDNEFDRTSQGDPLQVEVQKVIEKTHDLSSSRYKSSRI